MNKNPSMKNKYFINKKELLSEKNICSVNNDLKLTSIQNMKILNALEQT